MTRLQRGGKRLGIEFTNAPRGKEGGFHLVGLEEFKEAPDPYAAPNSE
jgi:hypothetical protein